MENNEPNTNNFLNWVDIKNFKSIKDLHLDCKRVNVFIGKPNVGKSNILEGLGLLGAEYGADKFGVGLRYDNTRDLFYDNDVQKGISVETNTYDATFTNFNLLKDLCRYRFSNYHNNVVSDYLVDAEGIIDRLYIGDANEQKIVFSPVKKYDFTNVLNFGGQFGDFLLPPDGRNLAAVINKRDELFTEMSSLFKQQGLELVLLERNQTFILQKKQGMRVKQYPFFSIADTFRRFMFYITAIESNENSVIIFEEPEVHSFPPYTQEMAYRMIYDEDNQYFISTHSPYLLDTFIGNMEYKDLNIFVTYYKDYQTHVRALTEEELRDILDYSTNVFFNLDRFIPDAQTNTTTA